FQRHVGQAHNQEAVELEVIRTYILQYQVEIIDLFRKEFEHVGIDGFRFTDRHDIAEAIVDLDLVDSFQSRLPVGECDQHRSVEVEIGLVKLSQDLEAGLKCCGDGVLSAGDVDTDISVKVPSCQKVVKGWSGVERLCGKRHNCCCQIGLSQGIRKHRAHHEFDEFLVSGRYSLLSKRLLEGRVRDPVEELGCPCHLRPVSELFLPEFNESFQTKIRAVGNLRKLGIIIHTPCINACGIET